MTKLFTTKEIETATGLKRNTLHYYIEAGAIVPHDPGAGRGSRRLLSRKNFIELLILKNFLDNGSLKQRNVEALKLLRKHSAWINLNIEDVIQDHRPVYLSFYLNKGALCLNVLVWPPPGKKLSFKNISDEDFFDMIKNPQYPTLQLTMTGKFNYMTLIDVEETVKKYRSFLL